VQGFIHRKGIWWMPRQWMAMKDVAGCDKLRGGAEQPLIRRCPNGETLLRSSAGTAALQGADGDNLVN